MEMNAWDRLLPEMLLLIAMKVTSVEDFIMFGAVSTMLRHTVHLKDSTKGLQPLPWLMLPSNENKTEDHIREFYSLSRDKIYKISLPVETKDKRVIETKGWLLTVSLDRELSLVHPFSHHVIPLPPQSAFGEYLDNSEPLWFVKKGVLSSDSSSNSCNNYILMVIFGKSFRLGFWEPGCQTWTVIETHNAPFEDIVYSGDKFYAIDQSGAIYRCNVRGCEPTLDVPVGRIPTRGYCSTYEFYLAKDAKESYGLPRRGLVIARLISEFDYTTTRFWAYEVDFTTGKWEIIHDLGGTAVFVGHNETVCIKPLKNLHGIIEGDHIYYTDHCLEVYRSAREGLYDWNIDMGTYNLRNHINQPYNVIKSMGALVPVWTFLSYKQRPCTNAVE